MLDKGKLENLYQKEKLSSKEIAKEFRCSVSKVNYWLEKHGIQKRSISEAIYVKNNPNGDPFSKPVVKSKEDAFLYGLGLGLYWGEGTKSSKHAVRLGNTDPELIKSFMHFLKKIYNIDERKLQFGLQIFSDMKKSDALKFWVEYLDVSPDQFYKVIITPSRGLGSYNKKIQHGVLTVHFNNIKLRDIVCEALSDPSLPE
ncbi:MAG: hypothetical protein WD552_02825 [Candidatus Paceibacterota bacterium]